MEEKITQKTDKICGRLCIEICGHLESPVAAGSGETEWTDGDVVTDAGGKPFIPGSSSAGALRAYLALQSGKERADQLFGQARQKGEVAKDPVQLERQSRIYIYDTPLTGGKVTYRDGVKLDEYKTAVYMSKFRVEAVEQGTEYRMRIEILQREREITAWGGIDKAWQEDLDSIKICLWGLQAGELRIGSRRHRGFGKFCVKNAKVLKFDMQWKEDVFSWLEWSWDQQDAFSEGQEIKLLDLLQEAGKRRTEHCLRIPLRIRDTILIRRYSLKLDKNGEQRADYVQLKSGKPQEYPIIPGSTWAGAVRSRMASIVKEMAQLTSQEAAQEQLEEFFGCFSPDRQKGNKRKASQIIFEESRILGGREVELKRNAIDRFTGGCAEGALYTENVWVGGQTELTVRFPAGKDEENNADVICGLMLWIAEELWNGFLAVGGETGVGRGIFEKQHGKESITLDGISLSDRNRYVKAAADWCKDIGRASHGKN